MYSVYSISLSFFLETRWKDEFILKGDFRFWAFFLCAALLVFLFPCHTPDSQQGGVAVGALPTLVEFCKRGIPGPEALAHGSSHVGDGEKIISFPAIQSSIFPSSGVTEQCDNHDWHILTLVRWLSEVYNTKSNKDIFDSFLGEKAELWLSLVIPSINLHLSKK